MSGAIRKKTEMRQISYLDMKTMGARPGEGGRLWLPDESNFGF